MAHPWEQANAAAQAQAAARVAASRATTVSHGVATGVFPAPYQPPIPAGYYDPSLDAQRDAASRGLLNTEQDTGLAGRRAQGDYEYDTGQIYTGYGRGMEDLATTQDRGLGDIGTQRSYENVDYGRNVEMLTRQTAQLGRQQAEQSRKYGVTSGGIALLSANKRAENEALQRRDIDTSHERTIAGLDTAQTRLGQDITRGQTRLQEDRDSGLGRASTLYDRGVADRGTTLSRARSEDVFYGLDVDALKRYQAKQAGWPGG